MPVDFLVYKNRNFLWVLNLCLFLQKCDIIALLIVEDYVMNESEQLSVKNNLCLPDCSELVFISSFTRRRTSFCIELLSEIKKMRRKMARKLRKQYVYINDQRNNSADIYSVKENREVAR